MERCLACEAEGSPPQIFLLRHRAGMEIGVRQGSCSPHPANRGTLRLMAPTAVGLASEATLQGSRLTNHLSLLTHPYSPIRRSYTLTNSGPQRTQRTAPAERNGPNGTRTDKLLCRSRIATTPKPHPRNAAIGIVKRTPCQLTNVPIAATSFTSPRPIASRGNSARFVLPNNSRISSKGRSCRTVLRRS
jgi:hypothetical protein